MAFLRAGWLRVCIVRYTTLNYVMNQTQVRVRKVRKHAKDPPDLFAGATKKKIYRQQSLVFDT